MTRRRLTWIALVAVAAVAAWAFSPDPLTDAERPFLGTWRAGTGDQGHGCTLTFSADHRMRVLLGDPAADISARWYVRDGWLYVADDIGAVERVHRIVTGWRPTPGSFQEGVLIETAAADRVKLVDTLGSVVTMERVQGE